MSDSTPQVTLVDIHGAPINAPAASWPSWTDATRWVPTEPAEDVPAVAEEPVEEWDFPPRRQVSPIELSMMSAGLAVG
jgi:hypothetical protein